ncbi:hypothetical protein ABZ341_11780, partial [Streptomyces sp. NPDC006173]|uniref:hypothetical protein n=1 Tax=Streptomyces sp. NPDC006173 TaxID=3155349 RepID=UPI0033DFCFBE
GYLAGVREICDRYGIVFILDWLAHPPGPVLLPALRPLDLLSTQLRRPPTVRDRSLERSDRGQLRDVRAPAGTYRCGQ